MTEPHAYEQLRRHQKAQKLAEILVEAGADSVIAQNLSQTDWEIVAELAGVKPPGDATQKVTVTMIRCREVIREQLTSRPVSFSLPSSLCPINPSSPPCLSARSGSSTSRLSVRSHPIGVDRKTAETD
jgi:hypothetical protein